jgi:hypothetical protein
MADCYNPENWYWIVGGSTTQVYSSAAVAYVPVDNSTYQSWLAGGNHPTRVATEQELFDVLYAVDLTTPAGGTAYFTWPTHENQC